MGVHFFCFFFSGLITWLIILMDNNKNRDMGNNLDMADNNLDIIHMGPNNKPMELNNKPITLTEEHSKAIILTVVVLPLVDIILLQVDKINLQHNLKQHITHGTLNTTIKSNKLNFKSCKHGLLVLILIAVDPSQHTNFKSNFRWFST